MQRLAAFMRWRSGLGSRVGKERRPSAARNAPRAERLKAIIPYNAVEALCGYWGGDRFYVPKMDSAARQWRDTEIRRLQPSHSTAELAIRFKLSYRAIEKIMAKTAPKMEIQPPTELQLTLQLY